MKRITRKSIWLIALVLAVHFLLVLAGCSSNTGSSSSSKPDESSASQASSAGTGALLSALPTGLLGGESLEITQEDSEKIERALRDMENLLRDDPNGVSVKQRNWARYSSPLGKAPLNDAEAAFYDRLDAFCLGYLKNADRSAVKSTLLGDQWSVAGAVPYADLGLTSEEAGGLYIWFLYNCPQYYFFGSGYLRNSREIQPYVYSCWADGSTRAEVTNDLFDKLDGWIDLVDENAGTTYQKEYLANDFLCETVTYDYESLEDDQTEKLSLNQSLYTAVMSENTVCAGYSKVFTAMMNAMDVPATGALSTGHAWNVVLCDDQNYYCVDVCWNATGGDKLGYLNVGDATSKARDGEQESHVYSHPEAKWIPAISPTDYQPTEYDIKGDKVLVDKPDPLQITILDDGEHDNGLLIDWPDVKDVKEYEFAIFANSSYSEIMVTSKGERAKRVDESQAKVWNLEPEKVYYYGVRAVKTVDGKEYYSDWNYFSERLDSVWDEERQLSKPAGVTVADDPENPGTGANISWNPVTAAGQYEFALFKDSTHDELWKSWNKTRAGIGLINLKNDQTYYYGIRAVKTVDGEDYYSNWTYGSFQLDRLATETENSTLSKPEKLKVERDKKEEDHCNFSWSAVDGAEKYQFARFKDETFEEIMTKTSGELHSWEVENPRISLYPFSSEDKTFYYGVRAMKTVGEKEIYSEWTYISFKLGDLKTDSNNQLSKPANLKWERDKEKEDVVNFSWDAVDGAEKYQFTRFTDETYETFVENSSGGYQSFEKEQPKIALGPFYPGRSYYYGVRAVKTVDGKEVYSDWAYLSFSLR